ncbi:MAG: hypothetical protein HC889_10565, partial [Synechococcaceae cyanobacterium SM1_2_3]|nr:hypothetical protein [Synechococcaceae cyanobacterium SM1_2_3]
MTPLPAAAEPKIAAPQQKSNAVQSKLTREDLINAAIDDLVKRKASKPRTSKTLRSTIHAKCGKDTPLSDIDAIYETLMKKGYVKVEGEKITYALP